MPIENSTGPHLAEDQLGPAAAETHSAHVAVCERCAGRVAARDNLAGAARQVSVELTGELRVPAFDALIGPALIAATSTKPVEVVSPTLGASWRLVTALTLAQIRLLPRTLLPLSLLGFIGCVLLAVFTRHTGQSAAVFTTSATLMIQLGALTACTHRTDPRLELFTAMPVSPVVVFTNRLLIVLILDTTLALLASLAAAALGTPADAADLITGWFGQAMFASAAGVVVAVWRSVTAGMITGVVVWSLGTMGTFSTSGVLHKLGSVIAPLWSGGPAPVIVAFVLLVIAVAGMGRPRLDLVSG